MKEVLKKVYYCGFCKKRGFVKKLIADHEAMCWGNPANRPACADCVHLNKQPITGKINVAAPYCTKFKKYVHTWSAMVKELHLKYSDHFENSELMPDTCDGQERYAAPLEADTFL